MDGTGCHVTGNEVAVLGIPLFEKVPALILGNALGLALVAGCFRNPYASTFSAGRFGHQAQLVFAWNGSGMYLDEFTVCVITTLLIKSGLRRSSANDRVGGLAKDRADAASANNHCVGWEGAYFHGPQVHGANAATDPIGIEYCGEKLPVLELRDLALGFVAPHLFIECVEKLLPGCGACEGGAIVERSTKAAEVEQAFRSAVERNSHAVEQIDNSRSGIAHRFDRRLVRQEVAAVHGVVEVLPRRVAFAFKIFGGIDATLGAHGVRAFHRDDGKQIDLPAHLGDL